MSGHFDIFNNMISYILNIQNHYFFFYIYIQSKLLPSTMTDILSISKIFIIFIHIWDYLMFVKLVFEVSKYMNAHKPKCKQRYHLYIFRSTCIFYPCHSNFLLFVLNELLLITCCSINVWSNVFFLHFNHFYSFPPPPNFAK